MNEFDPAYPLTLRYIDKSRRYYRERGFSHPYRWAVHADVPFAEFVKPLRESTIGLICTASLDEASAPKKEAYAALMSPLPDGLYTMRLFWHKTATHTDDVETFLPVQRMKEFAADGRIGGLSPRFYSAPTEYSQRKTREIDAPQILAWCREDGVDAAVLAAL